MDTKDKIYAAMMVISAFVLTFKWLMWLGNDDPVIYVSAMVLVASLAGMILNINERLNKIESEIEAKERSLRVNIQGVEESMDRKLDALIVENRANLKELTGRLYR
ncbi:MAG: hypothetical protein U9N46_02355 [Euryarchaeota archaeon]|nr:MAG: hypothetical protein C5S47_03690 [ANME-2 cluster archaeon]MEA1864032.1 hypothetical protein [Euryarchaeota archaeon]